MLPVVTAKAIDFRDKREKRHHGAGGADLKHCVCNVVPKVVDGFVQSFLEGHVRLPVQRALGEADVRPALLRVVLRQAQQREHRTHAGC